MIADACRAAAVAVALTLVAAPAAADDVTAGAEAQAAPRAEALFREGRDLYDAGRYAEACRKLAESQRLEPRVGTAGLLAACFEREGKLASAYRGYLDAERRARAEGDPRARFAAERAAAIVPRVPRLRIRAEEPVAGLRVTRNGAPVPAAELGDEALVDPGDVVIEASAPGRTTFWSTVRLAPGARAVVEIPPLAPDASLAAEGGGSPASRGSGARRAIGWAAGAIGLAGVGVGAGLGALALSRRSAAEPHCDAANRCTPTGGALLDDARTAADMATASFAVGLAGLGAGAILLLLPDPAPDARGTAQRATLVPLAGPGAAGAVLRGSW